MKGMLTSCFGIKTSKSRSCMICIDVEKHVLWIFMSFRAKASGFFDVEVNLSSVDDGTIVKSMPK